MGLHLVNLNALGHRAALDVLRGRVRQAERRAREAQQIIDRRGWASEPQALTTSLTLATVALSRHQLDAAGGHISRGLALSARNSDRAPRLALAISAVQLAVLRGDRDAAFAADTRLQAGVARTPEAAELLVRWSAVVGCEVLLLAGRPEEVAGRIATPMDDGFAAAMERMTLARAQFALGRLHPAEELLDPLMAAGFPYLEQAIAARLLHALIAERLHRDSAALAAVTSAIDLAQPESIRRPFRTLPGVADILRRYEPTRRPARGFQRRTARAHSNRDRRPAAIRVCWWNISPSGS